MGTLREFKKAPKRRGCLVSILKENQWFYKWKRCGADRSVPSVGFSYTSPRSCDQLVRLNLFQSRNRGNEMTAVSLIESTIPVSLGCRAFPSNAWFLADSTKT